MPDPTTFILFGATGDLARSKIWPALHDLSATGRLPRGSRVLGISRSASADQLRELAAEHGPKGRMRTTKAWEELLAGVDVVNGAGDDPELYEGIKGKLSSNGDDTLTYLSVAPGLFGEIAGNLAGIGLGRDAGHDRSRVIVEKPFGTDLASSHALAETMLERFEEDQVLRIDHYLGKETVQNLLVLRFANGIFEPVWDRRSVEHVEITVAETGGVGSRGEFYDATGALRDVGQNHLLQLLAHVAMEPPGRMSGDDLRQERLKVLRSVIPISPACARFGQYEGYRTEDGVSADSNMDTFVAMKVQVESWRWAGVPFYLRTGKQLRDKVAEIVVHFRPAPHPPFDTDGPRPAPNRLVVGIQPGEKVTLHVMGKKPGDGLELREVDLGFDAGAAAEKEAPEAYERLLGDAFAGDTTLFASSPEVDAQWAAIAPLLEGERGEPELYRIGSDGPRGAADLMARDGREWRPLKV
jgi:glucose-6-phosphate 1-dehydrogenase